MNILMSSKTNILLINGSLLPYITTSLHWNAVWAYHMGLFNMSSVFNCVMFCLSAYSLPRLPVLSLSLIFFSFYLIIDNNLTCSCLFCYPHFTLIFTLP